MPPKKVLEASIFVIDLTVKNIAEVRKVFYRILLQTAKDKADSKVQDVYKIILVGSKETDNVNNYDHIIMFNDWTVHKQEEVLKTIMTKLEKVVTGPPGNVFEALELAVEHVQNDTVVSNYTSKNVIVFTDLLFDTPNRVNKTALRLALEGIWLYVLGPHVKIPKLENMDDVKTWSKCIQPANDDINLKNNLKIIQAVKEDGIVADLEIGSQLFFSYFPITKPPYPWYCDMAIGEIILKINIFKLVDESSGFKFPKKDTENSYDQEQYTPMVDPDNGEIVEHPVPAYKIHSRYAVSTEEQENELAIKENEDKCFDLKYFVESSTISPIFFVENTICAVVADIRESENWTQPLKILAEAMYEQKVAAVMKRVYAKGPQFRETPYILFTCPDHGPECLLLAQLPFAHEIKWKKPIIRKCKKTEETQTENKLETNVGAYLSDLTVTDDDVYDGKPLFGISERLLEHPDFTSQFDHVITSLLDQKYNKYERKVPGYDVNPILEERSIKYWAQLKDLLPKPENVFDLAAQDFKD